MVKTTGLGGATIAAGCLGDDDDTDDGDAADFDDEDTVDPDDGDAEDIEEEDVVLHDITAIQHRGGDPLPGDANHFRNGDGPAPFWSGHHEGHYLGSLAFASMEPDTMLFDGWSYEPGVLEVYFPDNVYWWDGKQMDAHDHILELEYDDFLWGGDDLDAHENVVSYSLIDDGTIRYTLVDAWREPIAIENLLAPSRIVSLNANFLEPWVEQFRDAPDLDAIEDLREEIDEIWVGPDENEEILEQQHHIPMEFRFDGSLGDLGENYWEFEVVPERGGTVRKYVDLINFKRFRMIWGEFEDIATRQHLAAGSEMFEHNLGPGDFPDFEYETQTVQRPFDGYGFQFQFDSHPSDVPGFRRAWTYLVDNTFYERPDRIIPEIVGPFYTDDHNEMFISDSVIEDFTDYGYDEHRWDDAEAEMELWGFERNADGLWIMQEDGPDADAGEPMDLVLNTRWDFIIEEATDMWADFEDWGIRLESRVDHIGSPDLDEGLDEGMAVMAFYHGGGLPEIAFGSTWGRDSLSWSNPNIIAPSVIEGPEVGDTALPGDYDPSDWREYESRAMTDRLGVTIDEGQFQTMVDELSWLWNQVVPRFGFINQPDLYVMNPDYWRMRDMNEHPELTLRVPQLASRFCGAWEYVGPEEGPMDPEDVDIDPDDD